MVMAGCSGNGGPQQAPLTVFAASSLKTAFDRIGSRLQSVFHVPIPLQFLGMIPYVLTIIVVAGAMGRAVAPAAVGIPYKKG